MTGGGVYRAKLSENYRLLAEPLTRLCIVTICRGSCFLDPVGQKSPDMVSPLRSISVLNA